MENLRKEQIEEMRKEVKSIHRFFLEDDDYEYLDEYIADELYNAGYRKQKEGEWKYPPYAPFGGSYEMKRCSICGYKPDFDSDNPYTKFCPNCGAKMKGGAE